MSFDILQIAEVLRQAAKTEVLPRFRRLAAADIHTKSEATDLVTAGDVAAEQFLRREITALMPEARFIGEESVAADPWLLDTLGAADLAVVVDPIDGTANFVAGTPLFGVMAAITRKGEAVAGILYDPMGDDWVLAERGSGAFLVRPDGERVRLHVADPVPLDQMFGYASMAFLPADKRRLVLSNMDKVRMFACHRCAMHEYRAFSGGNGHFAMYSKLNPWDHLAGTLIAAEAGAHVACFDGSAYNATTRKSGLLLAPDAESWTMLMREVFGV